ncbi:hypothetical protein SPI_03795 [Niveomyces insectorum RCEF 264]|uniref:Uncharacterized protein n=1 Tax=Niveomyces insectorum RCEF 264 TaxID=1081102 RepID=A0A162J4M1_9HYPO|nr:hypothetical protein SPI_03795 [Niveomyces insectorum RCEF 264]
MAFTVLDALNDHPTAPVEDTFMQSQSSKSWVKDFLPIKKLLVHTYLTPDGSSVLANFDAFIPESDDDLLRFGEVAYPPNKRHYKLYSESDGIDWFHSEISNVVLPAFFRYPPITQNRSRALENWHNSGSSAG